MKTKLSILLAALAAVAPAFVASDGYGDQVIVTMSLAGSTNDAGGGHGFSSGLHDGSFTAVWHWEFPSLPGVYSLYGSAAWSATAAYSGPNLPLPAIQVTYPSASWAGSALNAAFTDNWAYVINNGFSMPIAPAITLMCGTGSGTPGHYTATYTSQAPSQIFDTLHGTISYSAGYDSYAKLTIASGSPLVVWGVTGQ